MGKSSAVQMLCAYYDKTCDSASLFDDLDVVEGGDMLWIAKGKFWAML